MMGIQYLPIDLDQYDLLHSLLTAYYRDGEDANTSPEELDAFVSLLVDLCARNIIFGCITYDGDPVGFVLWAVDTADFIFSNKPGLGTILEIGVVAAVRGRGLGKHLSEFAENSMNCGAYYVCAYGPAEKFWTKCGYCYFGETGNNGLKIFEKRKNVYE